jgi:hypothetical protein
VPVSGVLGFDATFTRNFKNVIFKLAKILYEHIKPSSFQFPSANSLVITLSMDLFVII